MGRRRKFSITYFKKWMKGLVSHDKEDLIAEVYGEVDAGGGTYVSKDLIGRLTVTYVFKEGINVENIIQKNSTGTDSRAEPGPIE